MNPMLQKIAENVITLLTVATIAAAALKARNWIAYYKMRQAMPALAQLAPHGLDGPYGYQPDPALVAEAERRAAEALERERDCRWLRYSRVKSLDVNGAYTDKQVDAAFLSYCDAVNAKSMDDLVRKDAANA